MTNIFSESAQIGDWLKGEQDQPKDYCREQVTILSGEDLQTGTVLGRLSGGGKEYCQLDPGATAGAGSDTFAGILITDHVGNTAVDQQAVALVRGPAVVSDNGLIWDVRISAGQKTTVLAAIKTAGIIVRSGA